MKQRDIQSSFMLFCHIQTDLMQITFADRIFIIIIQTKEEKNNEEKGETKFMRKAIIKTETIPTERELHFLANDT